MRPVFPAQEARLREFVPPADDLFYEPGNDHGLPRDPFKSCVVPRPIGWISTLSLSGVPNLAPFSQFQNLTFNPPHVLICSGPKSNGDRKDTIENAERSGDFVWNMATYELREAVNISAQEVDADVDEFELAGLTKVPSRLVKPYRVGESPIQFECEYTQTVRLALGDARRPADLLIGRVVGVHIAKEAIGPTGLIDILKIRPIARLGYYDYTSIESIFSMVIPNSDSAAKPGLLAGLEGSMARFESERAAAAPQKG
jgi:flavin reductase (DIM6/NTAB) family NADH-FMN oxidoreductase RutF